MLKKTGKAKNKIIELDLLKANPTVFS